MTLQPCLLSKELLQNYNLKDDVCFDELLRKVDELERECDRLRDGTGWQKVCDALPPLGQLVWLLAFDSFGNEMWLGSRDEIDGDGNWLWSGATEAPWWMRRDQKLLASTEQGDYQPTHWATLPQPPEEGVEG